MALLLKNGRIVTTERIFRKDIFISNGKIETIGSNLQASDKNIKIIDASDYYVLPGGVDPHVHMQLPVGSSVSADDFLTGTRAATAGGTTTIIDFVTPGRHESLLKSLQKRKKLAENSWCDYGLHMSITSWNPRIENEINFCINEGIPSFKIYMAYKDTVGGLGLLPLITTDIKIYVVLVRCEDHGITP